VLPDGTIVHYTLYGVVSHRGGSLNRGHYISFIRPAAEETASGIAGRGSWFCANDSKVTPVEASAVLRDPGCYLAFYEREPPSLTTCSTCSNPEN